MGTKSLAPFLLSRLESGTHPMVRWTNRDHRMFTITWKHAAHWKDTDRTFFKEYAIHTQKFVEGRGQEEKYPYWKSLLRDALYTSKEFQKQPHYLQDEVLYRYTGELPGTSVRTLEITQNTDDNFSQIIRKPSVENIDVQQHPVVCPTAAQFTYTSDSDMSGDIWGLDIEPLTQLRNSSGSLNQTDSTSNCSSNYSQASSSEAQVSLQSESLTSNSAEACDIDNIPVVKNSTLLKLENMFQLTKVEYCGMSANISRTSNRPLRLHSEGFLPQVDQVDDGCDLLTLPAAENYVTSDCQSKQEDVRTILSKLANGLKIESYRGNLYATNNSRVRIYASSEQSKHILLERNQQIEIFSHERCCAMMMSMYEPPYRTPNTEVYISFAKKWSLEEAHNSARILLTVNNVYTAAYIQMLTTHSINSLTLSSFTSDLANSLPLSIPSSQETDSRSDRDECAQYTEGN